MKTIFTTTLFMFITTFLFAQAPQGIPYQAVMRNADGSVMASSAVSLTFMIHDGAANGTVVYQESHSLTSNAQGLVSCVVGSGVVSQGNFSNINWGGGAKFLHVMMGTTDLGTQQMLSVPYALHSGSADNATNATNATNAINASNASNAETAANGFSNVSPTGDTLYMANGNFIIVPGISAANYQYGCTDAAACNYDATVELNNGSCLYLSAPCDDGNANTINDLITSACLCQGQLLGCTNPQACNYQAGAVVDDGSCLYLNATCNDGNANTTNDTINANCQCAGIEILLIGQDYQGGKVAYIFQPDDAGYVAGETHGLIAAAQDLPGYYPWGCYGTDISGADGLAIGTGAQNTVDIVNAGCGGAAAACANLVLNGYDDWFLPSIAELQQLYINRAAIGGFQDNVYFLNFYYSSSKDGSNPLEFALLFVFDQPGGATNDARNKSYFVRAVRAF